MGLGRAILVVLIILLVMLVSVAGVDLLKNRAGNPPVYWAVVVGGYLLLPLLLCVLFNVDKGETSVWLTYMRFFVITTIFLLIVTVVGLIIL